MRRLARRGGPRLGLTAGLLAIGIASAGTGCFWSGSSEERSALCPKAAAPKEGAGAGPTGVALIGENHLVRISLGSGRVEAERRLPVGRPPISGFAAADLRAPGQLLVQPQGAGAVLVLVRRGSGGRDEVLAVDPVTLRAHCRYPLEPGVRYRGIAVGSSGRIYAYGYREGSDEEKVAAVLTTLEPRRRPRLVTETVRPPNSDWWPYWGTVAPDERHMILTYHGSDTSGADCLDAAGNRFRRERQSDVHASARSTGRLSPTARGSLPRPEAAWSKWAGTGTSSTTCPSDRGSST
jgi:hypothetical protein